MNYWIEICKYRLSCWYQRVINICREYNKVYLEINDYMIDNYIIL